MTDTAEQPIALTPTGENLLNTALTADEGATRRQAFLSLIATDQWRAVLAPHVISRQSHFTAEGFVPDWLLFRRRWHTGHAQSSRWLELKGIE